MPVYKFNSDFSAKSTGAPQLQMPHGMQSIPAVKQLGHAQGGKNPFDGSDFLAYPYDVEEYLIPGFRSLDEHMKHYWSGIRVPTKDSYRFMRVKVAGGDKSLLVWADELHEGQARLPVAAIDRTNHQYNPEKFSPVYHAMAIRYLSAAGDKVAKVFRPVPFLVDYSLIIWAEHKRDIEYITYQVLTRFNPLAEFRMYDGKLDGNIQLKYGGAVDASDKEAGFDQQAKVRYEVTMTAEAWLPLPEKVVPTVMGRVTLLNEMSGQILLASRGSGANGTSWYEPTQT